MVMKSIFSTPGKLTQPAQPTVKTAPNMGTPNTPWQRGVTGTNRANATTPGGVQSFYRPARNPGFSTGPNDPQGQVNNPATPGARPTGDTSTWTPADWARYNTANQPAALKQPMWNGKPVQTGAYVAPSWKQPVAPPPAAAAPPPAAPPPTTGAPPGSTTAPPPVTTPAAPVPTIAELQDQYPGMPYSWYVSQQQAAALGNHSGG